MPAVGDARGGELDAGLRPGFQDSRVVLIVQDGLLLNYASYARDWF